MEDVAITIRIPEELKAAIDARMVSDGMTQTGVVRAALVEALTPRADRVYELPGMSPAFTAFFNAHRRVLLLVASGNDRSLVEGEVDLNRSNESLVSVRLPREKTSRPFLRRDVVGWFAAGDESDYLAMALQRAGWRARWVTAGS